MKYTTRCNVSKLCFMCYKFTKGCMMLMFMKCSANVKAKHQGCYIHHIISYYTCHYICIHDILFPAHAYMIVRGDNSIGIRRRDGGTIGGTSGHSSRRRGANS